jgi:hypothetical protein
MSLIVVQYTRTVFHFHVQDGKVRREDDWRSRQLQKESGIGSMMDDTRRRCGSSFYGIGNESLCINE